MASVRRAWQGSLVGLCYLLWTAVAIGLVGSAGLWLLSRLFGDGSDTSSAYEVVSENAQWLLMGSVVLGLVAGGLSWWVDRHVD